VYYQYPGPNQEFITHLISGKYQLTFGAVPVDACALDYGDFLFPDAMTLVKVHVPCAKPFSRLQKIAEIFDYLLGFVYALSLF
jgi:hypothetical protein